MLNVLCNLVSKIVFAGINGTIFIIPLLFIIYVVVGQAGEFIQEVKGVWEEER